MRIIMPALTLVLSILLDTTVIPVFYHGVFTVPVTLAVLLCIGLRLGWLQGALYGLFSGLVIDVTAGSIPIMAVAMLSVSLLCGLLVPENIETDLSVPMFHVRRFAVSFLLTLILEIALNMMVYFRTAILSWTQLGTAAVRSIITALLVVLLCPVLSRLYPKRAIIRRDKEKTGGPRREDDLF